MLRTACPAAAECLVSRGVAAGEGSSDGMANCMASGGGSAWDDRYPFCTIAPSDAVAVAKASNRVFIGRLQTWRTLTSEWMELPSLELPWPSLKACTKDALRYLEFRHCHEPVAIELHVDGSGKGDAPWSFCVLWQNLAG